MLVILTKGSNEQQWWIMVQMFVKHKQWKQTYHTENTIDCWVWLQLLSLQQRVSNNRIKCYEMKQFRKQRFVILGFCSMKNQNWKTCFTTDTQSLEQKSTDDLLLFIWSTIDETVCIVIRLRMSMELHNWCKQNISVPTLRLNLK